MTQGRERALRIRTMESSRGLYCGKKAQGPGDGAPIPERAQYTNHWLKKYDKGQAGYHVALPEPHVVCCPWETWSNGTAFEFQGLSMAEFLNERRIHAIADQWLGMTSAAKQQLGGHRTASITSAMKAWKADFPLERWAVTPGPTKSSHCFGNIWTMTTPQPVADPTVRALVHLLPWGQIHALGSLQSPDYGVNVFAVPPLSLFFNGQAGQGWMDDFVDHMATTESLGSKIASMSNAGKMQADKLDHYGFPANPSIGSSIAGHTMSAAVQGSRGLPSGGSSPPLNDALMQDLYYPDPSPPPAGGDKTMTYVMVGGGVLAAGALAWYLWS